MMICGRSTEGLFAAPELGLPLSMRGRERPCGRRENERGFRVSPFDAASFTGARVSEARVKYGAGSLPECRTVAPEHVYQTRLLLLGPAGGDVGLIAMREVGDGSGGGASRSAGRAQGAGDGVRAHAW